MANTSLTTDIIADTALAILDNELGWVKKLYRAHESEFDKRINGYTVGETISIRRPADFTVRSGATMDTQDVIEGKVTLTVDRQRGVDFKFTSAERTMKIPELAERVMKPAMRPLINHIANDCASTMYKGFYNWVGTPGNTLSTFAEFALAPERLDEMSVPMSDRCAVLSPTDHWGLVGNQTGLYVQGLAREAYTDGSIGNIGGIDTYMSQVTPTHTTGSRDDTTPLVDGASQNVTYDTAKNTWTQTLITDGHDTAATIKAGDVFTIADVYMVNQQTKAATGILQQFVVTADVTAHVTTTSDTNLVISPPIITSGPHQTVDSVPADDAAITWVGSASTNYRQNMVFHKNSMALAVVPMEIPEGAVNVSRRSYKDFSVRIIPVYDGVNDVGKYRLDILYGRELIDPRLGVRIS